MTTAKIINYNEIENNLNPLRILAAISIMAGTWSMLFEIYFFQAFQVELYLARISFTFLSTLIFALSYRELSKKLLNILIHILILGLIFSFIFTITMIPSTIYINSQILSLLIFTIAIIFSWEVTQQIIVAIYYNLLFAGSIFFSGQNIFQLPNILSLVIFVSFISLLSVAASWVIFKNRIKYVERTNEIKFLFDNAAIGIVRMNKNGQILAANKYFLNLFRITNLSNPQNLYDLLAPQKNERELLKQKISNENYEIIEESIELPDGQELYLEITAKEMVFGENNESTIECLISDKTKEKIAEKEKNRALEILFEEAREKQRHAQQAVEEKNQKIKLLAKINHEVRTPLNAILVYFDMIETGEISSIAEFKEFAKTVKVSAESLLQTINNFIDFAKIEAGKIELEEEKFNVAHTIKSTIKLLDYLAQLKQNRLTLNLNHLDDLFIKTDMIKYRQILINIVGNAIKFTQNGEINVDVSTISSGEQKKLITKIKDTGNGISQEKIKRMFEAFTTIEGNNSQEYSSGLGLAICREFTNILGGEISAESEPELGTMVTVQIPYKT